MKIRHILLLCSAAALPQLATADLAVTNPAGLGQVKALLDYCITSDPRDASAFKAQWQNIVGGQGSLLAQIEQNSAYQREYADLTGKLQKLPRGDSAKICSAGAAAWNATGAGGRQDHGKDDDRDAKPDKDSDRAHKPGQSDR